MHNRLFACAFVAVFFSGSSADCLARTWEDGVAATQTLGETSLAFRYYLPENYDPNISYPMVLYLHGSGSRGNDNVTQVANHISGLIDQTFAEYPAILVAPQAPSFTSWSTPSTRELTEDMVERIMADFSVDSNRLYLTGLSMGGFGTFNYLDYYTNVKPGVFEYAAAVPMGSGFSTVTDLSQVDPWRDTPIWMFHGDQDGSISVGQSRRAFRSFTGLAVRDPIDYNSTAFDGEPTAIDDNIRLTEIVGGRHNIWGLIYDDAQDDLYSWMFTQTLAVPEPTGLALAALATVYALAIRPRGSKKGPCLTTE